MHVLKKEWQVSPRTPLINGVPILGCSDLNDERLECWKTHSSPAMTEQNIDPLGIYIM